MMSKQFASLREGLWFAGFCLFALFAAVIMGLVFLVVAPFGLAWTGYEHARTAWHHRHLSTPQRKLLRLLRRKLMECENIGKRLDVPSPLDGVFQIQSLQLRNRLVMDELDGPFTEALQILGSCRAAGIPHDVLQPIWDGGLGGTLLSLDLGELVMLDWRKRNTLSGMVPVSR